MLEFPIPSESPIHSPDIKQGFNHHKPEKEILQNSVHIVVIILNDLTDNDKRVEKGRHSEENVDGH